MFVPCPHCGFLVALILPTQAAGSDRAAQRCPRCAGPLRVDAPQTLGSIEGDHAGIVGSDSPAPAPGSESPAAGAGPTRPPHARDREPSSVERTEASGASEAMVVSEAVIESEAVVAPDASDPVIDAATHAGAGDRNTRAATPDQPAPIATAPAARAAGARRAPSFVRGNARAGRSRPAWPWYAAIVMLGLVLALQLLLAQRHELAASARWRPWVASLCNALPCTIPPWREPQAFTMLDRSVQPSTAMAGVLAVEANFRNDARWPQPWPTLVLSLSDVEGRQVGARAFAPAEYRPPGVDAADLLAPGQGATVRLQVREPAPRIVAFTFDFQ